MFGDARTGGPYVEAETDRNALIVRGTVAQLMDIKEVLTALSEGGAPKGGMRMLNLQRGSALTLAEALQKILTEMRPNLSIKVIRPIEHAAGSAPKAEVEPKGAKPGKAEPGVTITVTGNRLLIVSQDGEALALTAELFRLLTSTGSSDDLEAIRLKHAQAREVARLIDEAFNGPAKGGGMPHGDRVRVIADAGTNSILIKANPLDTLTIRNLVTRVLDIEGAGDVRDERPNPKRGPGKKGAE